MNRSSGKTLSDRIGNSFQYLKIKTTKSFRYTATPIYQQIV
jgi:hypothetical protein